MLEKCDCSRDERMIFPIFLLLVLVLVLRSSLYQFISLRPKFMALYQNIDEGYRLIAVNVFLQLAELLEI